MSLLWNKAPIVLRYWKVNLMPCLFLDPGKVTAILRKAIYHPPILSSQPRLVLSHSPPEPKMSSFQWVFFFWPSPCLPLRRQSDWNQTERTKLLPTSCCVAHGCQWKHRKREAQAFLGTASRREMWWNLLSLISELAFINCLDSQRQDTNGGFERNDVMSAFLFFQNGHVFLLGEEIFPIKFYFMFM